ncbi:MAG TPA: pyruvate kinase alpha/beta domain-containing protein [Desulfomonilaceae bacterium]|nr:pyruvate kinase alpha/beta domain-containing protein [Desulfomonilaceae bacterium]
MIRQVEYFERPGRENTTRCLEIVSGLVDEGFSHLVVATTAGETALLFAKNFRGKALNMVAVTHNVGYAGPNLDECPDEARQELTRLGVKIFTGTILSRGIEASFMKKHQGVYPGYIVAQTLRLLGQGIKVCVEIVVEACDAGLVPEGEDIVAVAGTGKGADTVAIVQAHPSDRFLEVRVRQILAKPL